MNHHHCILSLSIGTLPFKGIWNRASNVKSLHGDPFAAVRCGSQFSIIDDVVGNDVLLDNASLCCHYIFQTLTRGNKNETTIFVLDHVIALYNASVRHHEGHFDVLDDASVALVVWQVSD